MGVKKMLEEKISLLEKTRTNIRRNALAYSFLVSLTAGFLGSCGEEVSECCQKLYEETSCEGGCGEQCSDNSGNYICVDIDYESCKCVCNCGNEKL